MWHGADEAVTQLQVLAPGMCARAVRAVRARGTAGFIWRQRFRPNLETNYKISSAPQRQAPRAAIAPTEPSSHNGLRRVVAEDR